MKVDARTRLIWRVRGTLGPQGHLLLVNAGRSPAGDAVLRGQLVDAIATRAVAATHPWADDRGLLGHAAGQLVDDPPADVCSWETVWALIALGITSERVAELNAAWAERDVERARVGQDDRLHTAQCAFYNPPPRPEQLDLIDLLIGQI